MLAELLRQLGEVHWSLEAMAHAIMFGLLLTIVIFAVSIPAYVISLAARGPLTAGATHLGFLTSFFWDHASKLGQSAISSINSFVDGTKLRFVFDHHEREFRQAIANIADTAKKIPDRINGRASELEVAINRLSENLAALVKTEFTASKPQIPDLAALQFDENAHRRALWKLWFGVFFAPALIVINTFIINEFFRGFITLYFYDVPLALILSFIFSFAELGLGAAIYIQQQKPQTGDLKLQDGSAVSRS